MSCPRHRGRSNRIPMALSSGVLLKMLQDTKSHTVAGFLAADFCRVSSALAEEICKAAKVSPDAKPRDGRDPIWQKLCIRPFKRPKSWLRRRIAFRRSAKRRFCPASINRSKGEFYTAVSRPPAVYRGNPFVIEAGLAFGKAPEETAKPQQAAMPLAEGEDQEARYRTRARDSLCQSRAVALPAIACSTFKAVLNTPGAITE